MTSRSRSRSRCKPSEVSCSWSYSRGKPSEDSHSRSRSGCNRYKVYWTKLNGDNGSYELPLTIGELKAKLPSLAANCTYKILNGTIVLKDSYYLAGRYYHLNVIIVKQEPSNKVVSDTGLHWVPIELAARYRPQPHYYQTLCRFQGEDQTYKLVSIQKKWYFSLEPCELVRSCWLSYCAFVVLVMVLLMFFSCFFLGVELWFASSLKSMLTLASTLHWHLLEAACCRIPSCCWCVGANKHTCDCLNYMIHLVMCLFVSVCPWPYIMYF